MKSTYFFCRFTKVSEMPLKSKRLAFRWMYKTGVDLKFYYNTNLNNDIRQDCWHRTMHRTCNLTRDQSSQLEMGMNGADVKDYFVYQFHYLMVHYRTMDVYNLDMFFFILLSDRYRRRVMFFEYLYVCTRMYVCRLITSVFRLFYIIYCTMNPV